MMLLYFSASTHQLPDESWPPLLVKFSVTKSLLIFKVFSLSLPYLCVCLSYFSLSSQTFVFIFLGLHKKESILPHLSPYIFFPHSRQLSLYHLCLFLTSSVSEPSSHFYYIPNISSTSQHHFLLSHITAAYIPISSCTSPSVFLCFSLAVWICPSPNRLSHLNDGCLRPS